MPGDHKPAVLFLRLSPQLRQALRHAADQAGVSLNAYAVQVLATAAGDPAAFRAPSTSRPRGPSERVDLGFPTGSRDRAIHTAARNQFMIETETRLGASEMFRLAKQYDAEDPGFYVEWQRSRRAVS
jgi:hypothetical protein